MKLLKNINRMLLLSVAMMCLTCLFACKTADSAAKTKETPQVSGETANTKADTYHALARAVTEQCPMKVDESTTLTKLEYREEQHALAYTYLFSGGVYEDMNAQSWAVVQKTTKSMLKEKLKTNQLLLQVRADRLMLIYIYKDRNDKELFAVTLEHGEY